MRHAMIVAGVLGLGGAPVSGQTLMAVSHWLVCDDTRGMATFGIEFNRSPDFRSTGREGAQADSFQFVLDTLPGNHGLGGASPLPWETIVRGEEIHGYSSIPVRDHVHGPSTQPGSGGWGPVAILLTYELVGSQLTFDAPYESLCTADGRFTYELCLFEYGSWTGTTYTGSTVPAPAGALALFVAGALMLRGRRSSRDPSPTTM